MWRYARRGTDPRRHGVGRLGDFRLEQVDPRLQVLRQFRKTPHDVIERRFLAHLFAKEHFTGDQVEKRRGVLPQGGQFLQVGFDRDPLADHPAFSLIDLEHLDHPDRSTTPASARNTRTSGRCPWRRDATTAGPNDPTTGFARSHCRSRIDSFIAELTDLRPRCPCSQAWGSKTDLPTVATNQKFWDSALPGSTSSSRHSQLYDIE